MGRPTPLRRLAAATIPVLFVAAGVAGLTKATAHVAEQHPWPSVGSHSDDSGATTR